MDKARVAYESRFPDMSHEMAVQKVLSAIELISLGQYFTIQSHHSEGEERQTCLRKKEDAYTLAKAELHCRDGETLRNAILFSADVLSQSSECDYSWLMHLVGHGPLANLYECEAFPMNTDIKRALEGTEMAYGTTESERCLWRPEEHR